MARILSTLSIGSSSLLSNGRTPRRRSVRATTTSGRAVSHMTAFPECKCIRLSSRRIDPPPVAITWFARLETLLITSLSISRNASSPYFVKYSAIVTPIRASISASVSVKPNSSLDASCLPMVVFPHPMKPIRTMFRLLSRRVTTENYATTAPNGAAIYAS